MASDYGLIVGKSAMSATGRATIIVGAFTSVSYVSDGILRRIADAQARKELMEEAARVRQQASQEAARARQQASQEAVRDRQFEIYKASHAAWEKSWGRRGPEPTWNENEKK